VHVTARTTISHPALWLSLAPPWYEENTLVVIPHWPSARHGSSDSYLADVCIRSLLIAVCINSPKHRTSVLTKCTRKFPSFSLAPMVV